MAMHRSATSFGRLLVVVIAVILLSGGAVVAADDVGNDSDREEFIVLLEGLDLEDIEDDPVEALRQHANETQAPVIADLDSEAGVRVEETYWIANAILISVDTSVTDPGAIENHGSVTAVSEHGTVAASSVSTQPSAVTQQSGYTYGLDMLDVPAVWSEFGTRGDGVTVAVLDTGVDGSHPDIRVDGWKDFAKTDPSDTPMDYGTHGTHVAGTVIGGDASGTHIGVAPDAEHIHGAVLTDCDSGQCEGEIGQLLEGMQWAVESEADILSMSLGTESYTPELIDAVRNADSAGTVVVGAVGNSGEGKSGSPANVYEAFAVGAVDSTGSVATFSGGEIIDTDDAWGDHAPASWPEQYIVPDAVAPGVSILSAEPGGDYRRSHGTSMATPHVAGTIALGQAATDREVSVDELRRMLTETARHPGGDSGQDHRYGYGIIDAHAYVTELSDRAEVNGTVTDAVTGEPVADSTVTIGGKTVTTNEDGFYTHRGVTAGEDVEITVEASGYEETVVTESVAADSTNTVDIMIAGDGEIVVSVTDESFTTDVSNATVSAGPYPAIKGANGSYVIEDVPSENEYHVSVAAPGYESVDRTVALDAGEVVDLSVNLSGSATIDIAVEDRVTGASLPDAALTIERSDGARVSGITDADGAFELPVAGTGAEYTVTAVADGYVEEAFSVSPGDGELISRSVELGGDGTISVTVTDEPFGDAVTGASVQVSGERGSYPANETAPGQYLIEDVPGNASYELVAEADGYEGMSESIDLESGDEVDRELVLPGGGTLQIAVFDAATDVGLDEVTITVKRETGSSITVDSDGDGLASVVVPGTGESYTVRAESDGYERGEESVAVGSDEPASVPMALVGNAEIAVTATDAEFDTTLTNVTVQVIGDRGTYAGVDTVSGIPGGHTYEVRISHEGYQEVTREVPIDHGEQASLTVELVGDTILDVSVTDGDSAIDSATVVVERDDGASFTVDASDGTAAITVPGDGAIYDLRVTVEGYEPESVSVGPVESGAVEEVAVEMTVRDRGLPGFGAIAAIGAFLGVGGWHWYRRRLPNG